MHEIGTDHATGETHIFLDTDDVLVFRMLSNTLQRSAGDACVLDLKKKLMAFIVPG